MPVQGTIFPEPSGDIRGVIIATLDKKKPAVEKRIAHCFLKLDGPEIRLDHISKSMNLAELTEYIKTLQEFAIHVTQNA